MENSNSHASFAARVKARRDELKLTQKAVAKLAGISQTTMSDIESGRNDSSAFLVELAKALQCSAEYLLHGEGGVQAPPELVPATPEQQASRAASLIEATLELAGFDVGALGSKAEIVAKLLGSDMPHTENENSGVPPKGKRQQNDVLLPNGTGHGAFFEPEPGEQKKSPKHGKGEG